MKINYEKFAQLCEERGKSQSAAAEEAGISKNLPGRWKNGTAEPSNASVKKLAAYFDVPVEYFRADDLNIMNGQVIGSAIMQGNSGSNIRFNANAHVNSDNENADQLTEQEAELLRIFRSLNVKGKTAMMTYAFAEEERQA